MKYYADCEFDGFEGPLLSLALIREDNEAIYIVYEHNEAAHPWVTENVLPIMWSIPSPIPGMAYSVNSDLEASLLLEEYFRGDIAPLVITDWPDDIAYICKALITGPDRMITLPSIRFEVVRRIDAYPTELKNAVQHNAYWDAQALRVLLS